MEEWKNSTIAQIEHHLNEQQIVNHNGQLTLYIILVVGAGAPDNQCLLGKQFHRFGIDVVPRSICI